MVDGNSDGSSTGGGDVPASIPGEAGQDEELRRQRQRRASIPGEAGRDDELTIVDDVDDANGGGGGGGDAPASIPGKAGQEQVSQQQKQQAPSLTETLPPSLRASFQPRSPGAEQQRQQLVEQLGRQQAAELAVRSGIGETRMQQLPAELRASFVPGSAGALQQAQVEAEERQQEFRREAAEQRQAADILRSRGFGQQAEQREQLAERLRAEAGQAGVREATAGGILENLPQQPLLVENLIESPTETLQERVARGGRPQPITRGVESDSEFAQATTGFSNLIDAFTTDVDAPGTPSFRATATQAALGSQQVAEAVTDELKERELLGDIAVGQATAIGTAVPQPFAPTATALLQAGARTPIGRDITETSIESRIADPLFLAAGISPLIGGIEEQLENEGLVGGTTALATQTASGFGTQAQALAGNPRQAAGEVLGEVPGPTSVIGGFGAASSTVSVTPRIKALAGRLGGTQRIDAEVIELPQQRQAVTEEQVQTFLEAREQFTGEPAALRRTVEAPETVPATGFRLPASQALGAGGMESVPLTEGGVVRFRERSISPGAAVLPPVLREQTGVERQVGISPGGEGAETEAGTIEITDTEQVRPLGTSFIERAVERAGTRRRSDVSPGSVVANVRDLVRRPPPSGITQRRAGLAAPPSRQTGQGFPKLDTTEVPGVEGAAGIRSAGVEDIGFRAEPRQVTDGVSDAGVDLDFAPRVLAESGPDVGQRQQPEMDQRQTLPEPVEQPPIQDELIRQDTQQRDTEALGVRVGIIQSPQVEQQQQTDTLAGPQPQTRTRPRPQPRIQPDEGGGGQPLTFDLFGDEPRRVEDEQGLPQLDVLTASLAEGPFGRGEAVTPTGGRPLEEFREQQEQAGPLATLPALSTGGDNTQNEETTDTDVLPALNLL